MKRAVGICVLLTALGDGVALGQFFDSGISPGGRCATGMIPSVPGVQGPWGQPVPLARPYMAAPSSESAARAMMSHSVPLDLVQATMPPGMMGGGLQLANCPPGGCPPGMPGPGGPMMGPPGAVAAVGALTGGMPPRFPTKRTEIRFAHPRSMKISWYAPTGAGKTGFTGTQLEVPGRYNFVQAAIYRLKLSDIPGRPGVYLYPTLEVVPSNAKTDPFLAHTAVPISFTDEDINQVLQGNYIIKVIYLPDPQFQDLAATGTGEIVSSLLEPGVDPIAEAHRRGNILCIVRMGNIDLEAPETPAMDAPSPYQPKPVMPVLPHKGMAPVAPGGRPMAPYGMMAPNGQMLPPGMPMMPGAPMMGPNGQMMMPPAGPMMTPGAGKTAMLPAAPDQPAMVQMMVPAPTGKAVAVSAPDAQPVAITTMKQGEVMTPAAAAAQSSTVIPVSEKRKTRGWWSRK